MVTRHVGDTGDEDDEKDLGSEGSDKKRDENRGDEQREKDDQNSGCADVHGSFGGWRLEN